MRAYRPCRTVAGNHNPLQRHVDRIESAIVAALIVVFLVGAPLLSVFAVMATGAAAAREQRAESDWRPVTAVLQESAAAGLLAEDGVLDTAWVTARWTAPDHLQRNGLVAVDLNARAGQRITIWVTYTGQLAHPRLSRGEALEWEATGAIVPPIGLALLLVVAVSVVRVLANRRRMADWTQAWAATGPRWSSLR